MRYIDAEEIEKRIDIVLGSEPKAWDKKALKELKMYIVHAVPTADVRENVRGEWISKMYECSRENYDQVFCCSVCGVSNDWRRTNFCPHCGADMRGES